LAKTIRTSCRTFELFDIAKTVIAKQDRFVVVLDRKPSKNPEATKRQFYVSMPDSVPFENEEEAINHVMSKHLDRFFSTAQVETDPPKGSFQVINRCGVTGQLLGPPNYHLYNQTLQQHHANRLERMPFETFKSRVESVREPEVIEAWLELMKKVTRYTWLGDGKTPTSAKPESTEPVPAAPEVGAESETVLETSADTEAAATDAPTDAADVPAAEVPEAEAVPAPVADDAVTFDSVNEAKVFLLTQMRDKVVRTFEHGRFHGRELENMPDGEIKQAVLGALERQQRFPLDSANALRGRLRREGFTIFKKGSKGVSYVCAVKRKFRVPGQTFADSIDQLISFIEKTPMIKVSALTEKFLKISSTKPVEKKPAEPVVEEPASEAEAPVAPAAVEGKSAETKSAEAPSAVKAGPEKIELSAEDLGRFKRMTLDLRWLVTEGYVTEFIDGGLFAAPPIPLPKPKPTPKPKPKPKPKTEVTVAEAAAATGAAPTEEVAADTVVPAEPPAAPAEVAAETPDSDNLAGEDSATLTEQIAPVVAPSEVVAPDPEATPELVVAPEPVATPEPEAAAAPEPEAAPAPEVAPEPAPAASPEVTESVPPEAAPAPTEENTPVEETPASESAETASADKAEPEAASNEEEKEKPST